MNDQQTGFLKSVRYMVFHKNIGQHLNWASMLSEEQLASTITYLRRQMSICIARLPGLMQRVCSPGCTSAPGRGGGGDSPGRQEADPGHGQGGAGQEGEGSTLAAPHPPHPGLQGLTARPVY
jgi:hypothetical protein